MKDYNGVIAVLPTGETIVSNINAENPRHWCCFDEIETKLNLNSNCGTDQMEHAWYLARKGIISFQVAKDICYIITSPELEMIPQEQLKVLDEIVENDFYDVETFGVDFVSKDKHQPVIIGNKYEFGIDDLNQIFNFDSIKKHRSR